MQDYKSVRYTVRKDGQEFGPFTGEEIKEMLNSSVISAEDEISLQNLNGWQKIKGSNIWYDYLKN